MCQQATSFVKVKYSTMNYKIILTICFFGLTTWSCQNTALPSDVAHDEVKEMVTNAQTTLVDVRIPEQFAAETAQGAVNIPLNKVEENLDFFRKQKQIVIFCNSGRQSGEAVEILKKNGITNVYDAKTLQNINAFLNK